MKVYISGSFSNKGQIKLFIGHLEKSEHIVTYDWTRSHDVSKNHMTYGAAADEVYKGISDSDILVCIFGSNVDRNRGVFVEIGIALGMGKNVYILNSGHSENITWLPSERIETNIFYHYEPRVKVFSEWKLLLESIPK